MTVDEAHEKLDELIVVMVQTGDIKQYVDMLERLIEKVKVIVKGLFTLGRIDEAETWANDVGARALSHLIWGLHVKHIKPWENYLEQLQAWHKQHLRYGG